MLENVFNGIYWVYLEEGDLIEREPFYFGKKTIMPGDIIPKLGTKDRTSFDIGVPIQYMGFHKVKKGLGSIILLFQPTQSKTDKKTVKQLKLFEENKLNPDRFFMGIMSTIQDQSILLIPTNENFSSFYDIRP